MNFPTHSPNQNLYAVLRAAFPQDLNAVAVQSEEGGAYSWRDLERASAMLANLLLSLPIAPGSRIAVQVEPSVEAMLLGLAVWRAGHVFVPLNSACQSAEMEYFIGDAQPAVVVCTPQNFSWVSRIAFKAGVHAVFTLGADRSGSLLERAAHCSDSHEVVARGAGDLAAILYTSLDTRDNTGRSKDTLLRAALNQSVRAELVLETVRTEPVEVQRLQEGFDRLSPNGGFVPIGLSHGDLRANALVLQDHWPSFHFLSSILPSTPSQGDPDAQF